MRKTLTSLVAAASLGAGLLGCASSSNRPSQGYETNAFSDYGHRTFTESDVDGFKVKQTKIGRDSLIFLNQFDPETHQVWIGEEAIPGENVFRYPAVRASKVEPRIFSSESNRSVRLTKPEDTLTVFVYDPNVKGVRTNIPVTRSLSSGSAVSYFDLGKFEVPMLRMPLTNGKEKTFQDIRYCITSSNDRETAAIIVGGALMPNYKAGVMEFRGGEVFLEREGARIRAKPQAQAPAQDDFITGELIFDITPSATPQTVPAPQRPSN